MASPYDHHWRTVTRPEALRRAGGVFDDADGRYLGGARCQRCGVPDPFPLSVWQHSTLDVAHLVIPPGAPGHDDEDNLAALCRKDHRANDYADWVLRFKAWVAKEREERAARLDAGRPLLLLIAETEDVSTCDGRAEGEVRLTA